MNYSILEKVGSMKTESVLKYDTVVVGGGSAGISAAASAAKNGSRVLLIEAEYEELNPDPDLSVIEPEECKEANLQDTDNEYEELKMQPANLENEEHISHNEEE
jgi:flavin-dependent dehydrogenase